MRKISVFVIIIVLLLITNVNVFAADGKYAIKNLKEDTVVLQGIRDRIFPSVYMQRYCDGLMASHFDAVYYHSNEGLFLYLYELIYEDSETWLTEGVVNEEGLVVYYNTIEERKLRINRLLDDGYITQEEVNKATITKEMLANILYRIYGECIPFKGSVDYTDTANFAVEWASEIGLPYFNYNSGFRIYPDEQINVAEYSTIITYAYLFLPNVGMNEYRDVSDFVDIHVNDMVLKLREEIKKPRLGYWKRDVMNNDKIKDLVNKYQEKKRKADLIEIHNKLREMYNLFNYQDDIGYVRYMFTLYK